MTKNQPDAVLSNPKPRVILADDFTGAADAAVHFAAGGMRTALVLDPAGLPAALPGHQAAALSTESRFLSPAEAAAAVQRLAHAAIAAGAALAYKKNDSTLRGNPGAEITAALAAVGLPTALVCPASPATGRTVRGGVLFVHGVPLPDSGIGQDPVNPVLTGSAAEILAQQTALPISTLSLATVRSGAAGLRQAAENLLSAGARLIIPDAETTDDLHSLAGLLRTLPLLPAGAAGLAEAIVAGYGETGKISREAGEAGRPPAGTRVLAVVGSLTAETREQIKFATESGLFFLLPLDVAAADTEAETARLLTRARAEGAERHLLLTSSRPPEAGSRVTPSGAREVAGRLARAAARIACAENCAAVYATGGSTAVRVAAELGITALTVRREVAPGVVFSECRATGCGVNWFISKAGGFGTPQTLMNVAEFCAGR